MRVYQSNDLEVLADLLEENILQGSLFNRRYLIVPSNFLKNWLFERWAQKNKHVIAIETFSIQEAVSYFLTKTRNKELFFPSIMELEFFIREEIVLSSKSKDPIFTPLKKYLEDNEKQKLSFLSSKLAELFSFYGQYGLDFILKPKDPKDWQEKIYRQVFAKKQLHTPIEELTKPIGMLDSCDIHLFCFSFLPPAYFDFFYRLSDRAKVSHFILSPCSKYWEDLATHFEERKARKQYKEVEWIDDFFQTNPILANFGVLGKYYQNTMSPYDLIISEHYKEKEGTNFLKTVQNDILHLQKTEKKTCPSIQCQPVLGTKFDEVQTLQKNLSFYFSQGYLPSDILILAEDINEYLPFIFAEETLDYKISDISLLHQSFLARAILHILSLAYEKWTLKDLYQLFENPLLQKTFHFTQDDVDLFYTILKSSKLKCGYDEEHMKMLFGKKIKDHTWKDVLQRLVLSLAVRVDEKEDFAYPYPIEGIEISDANMLNTFIGLIETLKGQVDLFQPQSLKSWAMILEQMMGIYFSIEPDQFIEQSAMEVLQSVIVKFKQISCEIEIDIDQIYSVLHKEFQRKTISNHANLLDTIHFASLREGNIKPAKIIYILGMNQDTVNRESSLNLLKDTKQFYPTNSSKKKYLLLEHLTLAKEKIVFSYPTKSHHTSQELTPSLLLQELRSYLGDFFEMPDREESISHRVQPFAHFSYPSTPMQRDHSKVISISSLKLLANNPFDFYLKQKWKMNFDIKDTNEFALSSLEQYQMIFSSLKQDCKQVMDRFDRKAIFPQGIFKEISMYEMERKVSSYTSFIKDETIYLFRFQKDCKEPFLHQNVYTFPAVKVPIGKTTFYIVGTLFHITKQGMLLLKEDTLKEKICSYPSYLMYLKAIQSLDLFEPNLLFLRAKKIRSIPLQDPDHFLEEYIRYYLVASHTLSPFMDFAISSLVTSDRKKFIKNYHTAHSEQKNWLIQRMDLSNVHKIFNSWSSYLKEVFQPIL